MKSKTIELEIDHRFLAKARKKLAWKSNSISELKIVNLIQFLTADERIRFVNELFRVMKKGGKVQIHAPHWCAARAWGDLAFQQPPVSEAWFPHLDKDWRKANAPWGAKYKCDFTHTLGYGMHVALQPRNDEWRLEKLTWAKEAAADIICTLIKK